MFVALWFGLLAGFIGTAVWGPRFRKRRKETWVAFRQVGDATPGVPYRGDLSGHDRRRTRAEVVAAARSAGLDVREHADGFEVHGEGRRLTVRMLDRTQVTLASLEIIDQATEKLVFELALALVPLYGPILVREAKFGSAVVDGSRDADALREERGERIREIVAGVMVDLKDMQRTYGDGRETQ